MKQFCAYYRVSTSMQGASGLGLEAQRAAVARFVDGGKLIAEYTEIESGKRHTNRPKLVAALAQCKKAKAILLVAKLDRLARNVAFISALMESGVEFIAADMPFANKLTVHVLAAVAEHERELISSRLKNALAAKKARGIKLGSPDMDRVRAAARGVWRAHQHDPEVIRIITDGRKLKKPLPLRVIADRLNKLGIPSSPRDPKTRGKWHASSVRNALAAVHATA